MRIPPKCTVRKKRTNTKQHGMKKLVVNACQQRWLTKRFTQ